MLRRALYWSLLVLGGLAAIAYPASDLAMGRGLQWANWFQFYLAMLVFYLVGAFVFARHPDHLAARRILVSGTFLLIATTLGQLISVIAVKSGPQAWFWLANALQQSAEYAFAAGLVGLFAVFPDGRYQRAYERFIVRALAVMPVFMPVLVLLTVSPVPLNPNFVWAAPVIASPFNTAGASALGRLVAALYNGRLTVLLLAAVLLVLRYRRFGPEQRLQARWPLFSLLFVVPFGMGTLGYLFGFSGLVPAGSAVSTAGAVVMPTLPATLGIGLLRPHLLDLEVVIRKSVVYAALWLVIAVGYVVLAAAIGVAAAQRYQVGVVVLVTILATLAFQPARAGLEKLASRLVYGRRLSGYEAVSRLGAGLQAAPSPEQAAGLLEAAVRQALDARWARVVIPDDEASVSADDPGAAVLAAPLVHGDEVLGRVECGPRSEGRYRRRDQELLVTLARHAVLAIRNARLAVELADRLDQINLQTQELLASRARIVLAEESGRRRLERDIHDGVQQELVALLAKIRLARNRLARDPAAVGTLLEELQEETRLALSDLRDLAQGIHPTVLSDRGLVEAIEQRVSRLPAGVTVEASEEVRSSRFSQAVEGAAYFTVCEGIANAMKHAPGSRLAVRLGTNQGELEVEISDDGPGFDPQAATRSGLSGLEDRIEALGGQLEVSSRPGRGTRLLALLPASTPSLV